jgi:hypothetical protein
MAGDGRALRALHHPVTLLALGLWLVNDHLLKAAVGGWLVGKLSDVACLVVVPWLPVVLFEQIRRREAPGWLLPASAAVAGSVMVSINLVGVAAWAYRHGLAALQWPFRQLWVGLAEGAVAAWRPVQLTMDPSDVVTVVALAIPLWIHARGGHGRGGAERAQQRHRRRLA